MGCPKLTYYDNSMEALKKKKFFFTTECLEKKVCRRKNRLDYYPFGMAMPGRTFSSNQYRYGFNGKEKDDEVKGEGNSYNFGARIYDPRIGKWLAVDPKASVYPGISPYVAFGNDPLYFIDPEGETLVVSGVKAKSDVKSALPESYKSLISVNDANEIVFNITKEQVEKANDPGVQVVYDLVNSSFTYSYKTEETYDVKVRGTNKVNSIESGGVTGAWKIPDRWTYTAIRDENGNVILENYVKKTRKSGKKVIRKTEVMGWVGYANMPIDGNVDNERNIAPSYSPIIGTRESIVLHELLEMFQETDNGLPYRMHKDMVPPEKMKKGQGAHNTAVDIQSPIPITDTRTNVNIKPED